MSEERIKEIEFEITELQRDINKFDKTWDYQRPINEYQDATKEWYDQINILDREKRLLMIPEYEDIPSYGDKMSLIAFVVNVVDGNFIDYDGSGNYVKDEKMSNIGIYPSDVAFNSLRSDFDTIIWFNR